MTSGVILLSVQALFWSMSIYTFVMQIKLLCDAPGSVQEQPRLHCCKAYFCCKSFPTMPGLELLPSDRDAGNDVTDDSISDEALV
jgi:hypothetical protein